MNHLMKRLSLLLLLLPLLLFGWSFRRAPEAVSYEEHVRPILDARCTTSGCHDGTEPPYLRSYQEVRFQRKRIAKRIEDPVMPMPPRRSDNPLTSSEKWQLLKWIEAGAPNN